jgi:hypothetical protein
VVGGARTPSRLDGPFDFFFVFSIRRVFRWCVSHLLFKGDVRAGGEGCVSYLFVIRDVMSERHRSICLSKMH